MNYCRNSWTTKNWSAYRWNIEWTEFFYYRNSWFEKIFYSFSITKG